MALDLSVYRALIRAGVPNNLAAGLAGDSTLTDAEKIKGLVYGGMDSNRAVLLVAGSLSDGEELTAYEYMGLEGKDAQLLVTASLGVSILSLAPALWIKADSITGKITGDSVTAWTDLSGGGHPGDSIGGGGTLPQYRAAGDADATPAGGPSVKFLGSGYFTFGNVMASAAAGEVFCVLKADDAQNGLWIFGSIAGVDSSLYPYTGGFVYEAFGCATGQRKQFTPTLDVLQWRRYNVWSAAGDWAANLNEVSQATGSPGTVTWYTNTHLGASGFSGGLGEVLNGCVAEMIVFARKLTTPERAYVNSYLGRHF